MIADPFIRAVLVAPADDAVRLVYADWLEEHGDIRGDFLRLEVALAAAPVGDPGRGNLRARLQEAGAGIDPAWLAIVSRVPIENCGVEFQFQCPKQWEQLQVTTDEAVRFCSSCRREVFFCSNLKAAQSHAALGECIAIDPRLARRNGDLESNVWESDVVMLGLPSPEELEPAPKDD